MDLITYILFFATLIMLIIINQKIVCINKNSNNIIEKIKSLQKDEKRRKREFDKLIEKSNIINSTIKKSGIDTYRQIMAANEIEKLIGGEFTLSLRGWPISPDALLEILKYIKSYNPNLIIELGCGSSTVAIAALIKRYGLKTRLISIDHLSDYLNETKQRISYKGIVELILAPIKLQKIKGIKNKVKWYDINPIIDVLRSENVKAELLLVDGPPESLCKNSRLPALMALSDFLSDDAVIFLDDYGRVDEQFAVQEWLNFDKLNKPSVKSIETEKGLAIYKRKSL